jgi:hypothetical protein
MTEEAWTAIHFERVSDGGEVAESATGGQGRSVARHCGCTWLKNFPQAAGNDYEGKDQALCSFSST